MLIMGREDWRRAVRMVWKGGRRGGWKEKPVESGCVIWEGKAGPGGEPLIAG